MGSEMITLYTREEDYDENPFGRLNDAKGWLENEMKSFGNGGCYRPHLINPSSLITDEQLKKEAQEQLEKAGAEYWKRVEKADREATQKPILPVLVMLGLSKKMMDVLLENDLLGGRFLYFPTLNWKGKDEGSLFLTYMAGPAHGTANFEFSSHVGNWREANDLDDHLAIGRSCGDLRIFPERGNKDNRGNDQDTSNYMNPHSRFYFEIEHTHRDIIGLRRYGKKLMSRTTYTRLFAGCKFTGPTEQNKNSFEAGLVLWGKNEANEIELLKAIDFGSRELDPKSKQDWSESRANMLPAVPVTMWNRPGNAGDRPWRQSSRVTNLEPEWVLWIPIEGLLYKVTDHGSDEYLISPSTQRGGRYHLNGSKLTDMNVNIKKLARKIATQVERDTRN